MPNQKDAQHAPAARSAARRDAGIGMVRTVVNDPDYRDRYAVKLVKYIPGEVLAAFIPLVALADKISAGSRNGSNDLWIWVTIGIGVACVIGYNRWQATDMLKRQLELTHGPRGANHWSQARIDREHKKLQPDAYFYVLSVVAFAAWALATAAPVRSVVGLSALKAEYIVAAVTFILPLADATLAHLWAWVREHASRDQDAEAGLTAAAQQVGRPAASHQ